MNVSAVLATYPADLGAVDRKALVACIGARFVTRAVVEACAAACKACGDECGRHAQMHEHCRVCADACHRCEEACSNAAREAWLIRWTPSLHWVA
jgi:hypothetical protein